MSVAEKINAAILVLTIVAIILGPIFATLISRRNDDRRLVQQRKFEIYRTLMQTRTSRLSPDHVRALNTIPVEFHDVRRVLAAFRGYLDHLSSPLPAVDQQDRYFRQRNDLFLDFLFEIGSNLGYAFDRHELDRLSYMPVAFADDEDRQRRAQALLVEILEGRRAFPVSWILPEGGKSVFPPKPE